MDATREGEPTAMKGGTTIERKSEREMVVTRIINGPARIVFEAFAKPELFRQWWVPKSFGLSLLSCEADVRAGGRYRLVFDAKPQPMEVYGRDSEDPPNPPPVRANEKGEDGGAGTPLSLGEERG